MNTPLSRVLKSWRKPLFCLTLEDLDAAGADLRTLETLLKPMRGARLERLSAERLQALEEAKAVMTPAAARILLSEEGWFEEISRWIAEARVSVEREARRHRLTPEQLRTAAWTEKRRFTVDLIAGGHPLLRETAGKELDGLDRILAIARAMARRCLPAEASLRDARGMVMGQAPAWADKAADCGGSVAVWRAAPDLLRISYFIRGAANAASVLGLDIIVETRSETPSDLLAKSWLQDPNGPLHKLGKSVAFHARQLPWRSLTELVGAIKEYRGGPTDLLAELALHRREELRLLSKDSTGGARDGRITEKLPLLIEGSSWPILRKHALPLVSDLQVDPAVKPAIVKSLLKAADSIGESDVLATDTYLADAVSALMPENRHAGFAKAAAAFFAPWNWNPALSKVVRELSRQSLSAPSALLPENLEEELVTEITRCLHKASTNRKLPKALDQFAHLLKAGTFSPLAERKLLAAAGDSVADLRTVVTDTSGGDGIWLRAAELKDFLDAILALRAVNGPWRFKATWDTWIQRLPKRGGTPLRYPAALVSLAAAWLRAPSEPKDWPVFSHVRDVLLWQVGLHLALGPSVATHESAAFDEIIGGYSLSPSQENDLRFLALELIAASIERAGTLDENAAATLSWVVQSRPDLVETTRAVAALAPWKHPKLRLSWRRWFTDAWNGDRKQAAAGLFRLLLTAWSWSASQQQREQWLKLLEEHGPFAKFIQDIGTPDQAVRLVVAEANFARDDLEDGFSLRALAGWMGRKDLFEAVARFCEQMRQGVKFGQGERMRLLVGSLSNEELRVILPDFLTRHEEAAEFALDDPSRSDLLISVVQALRAAGEEAGLLDQFFLGRFASTAVNAPLETWRRFLAVRKALGPTAAAMLPSLYRHLSPGLLPKWLGEGNKDAIKEFAAAASTALVPVGRLLVGPLAGEFLVKTRADWPRLKEKAELLTSAFTQLGLNDCYHAKLVRALIDGPAIPPETGLLLLASLFCAPAHIAHNMMEDLAWQAASVHRLADKPMAAVLSSLALHERA